MKTCLPIIGTLLAVSTIHISAATLLGGRTTVPDANSTYNLTTLGTTDWVYWDTSADPASGTPTDEKSGAAVISAMSAIGGGSVRGTDSLTKPKAGFTWVDGTNTAIGSQSQATGLFHKSLDTAGRGVGMTVTIPTTETYTVTVWTYDYAAAGTFTASMQGATSYQDTTLSSGVTNPKGSYFYTLTVTPDAINGTSNLLSIQNVMVADNTDLNNSHVGISAVTISVIPEPSSCLLVSLAALSLLGVRRR